MKRVLLVILTCLVCATLPCFATVNDGVNLLQPNLKGSSKRPHAPNGQVITCMYCGGNICLDFVYPEGQCDLYVFEEKAGYVQHFSFDSSELSVLVEVDLAGKTHISLVTEYGNTYEGVILDDDICM